MAAFCLVCKLEALVFFSMGCSASPGGLKCEKGTPFAYALAHLVFGDFLLSGSQMIKGKI